MVKKKARKTSRTSRSSSRTKARTIPVRSSSSGPSDKMTLAIVALVINIFIPGLGSLIAGKTTQGIWQLVLLIIGAILSIILIGIPLMFIAWVWAIVTGARLIQEAQ